MQHVSRSHKGLLCIWMSLMGFCLSGLLVACRVCGVEKEPRPEPYSPVEGDTSEVIIVKGRLSTVGEAMDEAFKESARDSLLLDLRKEAEEKYRQMGDSMLKKLMKGKEIH